MATLASFAGSGVATAQAYVYWSDNGPGLASTGTTLGRANNDGSAATFSLVSGADAPAGIAVDGAHIYWADTQKVAIGRANLDGGGANDTFIPNATSGSASALPTYVALDGTYIYWTDGVRWIGRAGLDGQGAQPHFIDVGSGSYPRGIAVDAGTIYVTGFDAIARVAATGGTPTTLITLPAGATPTALAVADGYLYWGALNLGNPTPSGTIGRALTSGGGLQESFIPGLQYPTGVATDGTQIYWVDHTPATIGRALLGSSGATNVQTSFASDPAGPMGVAVDSLIDPTTTTVSCAPPSVAAGAPTTCTATVGDSASSSPPTGTVVFSGNGSTFFSGSSSCTLSPIPSGGSSCVVGTVPLNAGTVPVNAAYGGDPVHRASTGATTVCAASGAPCGAASGAGGGTAGGSGGSSGGGSPGGGQAGTAHCIVPNLMGKSLSQARRLLTSAHCALGKVTKPHAKRGHRLRPLVAGSQLPAAGRTYAVGQKVALRLVQNKPPRKRKHR